MDTLFERMPKLARLMMLGIMIMFIAPFGMLIAKWATLITLIGTRQIALILMLAFGSAATFMFWAKWLGKLAGIASEPDNVEVTVHKSEWLSLALMAVLAVLARALIPVICESSIGRAFYVSSILGMSIRGRIPRREPLSVHHHRLVHGGHDVRRVAQEYEGEEGQCVYSPASRSRMNRASI